MSEKNNTEDLPVVSLSKAKNSASDNVAAVEAPQSNDTLEMIIKSLVNLEKQRAARLSFEVNPNRTTTEFGAFYRTKNYLTPDSLIKRLTGPQGDELVNQILQAKSNQVSAFGRPSGSRHSIGFDIVDLDRSRIASRTPEESIKLKERIARVKRILWNCGHGPVDDEPTAMNLSQCLKMLTRDGLRFGRFACERIFRTNHKGEEEFFAFRPVDAGTIYKVLSHKEHDQSTRKMALELLRKLKNDKFNVENYLKDEYKWVQVIDDRPVQGFTEKEMVVYNMYPVTDVEYNGYPLTPIDQALNAIVTHISITIHNRLYFQNGRAAKGMLIFKTESADESEVQKIRLQFYQSINSVQNSWRMPIFTVGQEDELTWQPIDVGGRDGEFQYLMDNNARIILSAFQMSPEELPGYAHLARGTNTQALSETNNEWKLTAARDAGMRPMLYDIQDFLNTHILPLIDEELAKTHRIVLCGLEKYDPEREAVRLQQDMNLHLTYNDILEHVEKQKLPKEIGGDMPLNPQFKQQVIDQYFTVGTILEFFMGIKDASKDPRWNYVRDPYWMQYQQILLQKAQFSIQMQMQQQQQLMMDLQPAQPLAPPPANRPIPPDATEEEKAAIQQENMKKTEEWLAQNYLMLDKSIKHNHNEISKIILKRHKELVDKQMKKFKEDSKKALEDIKNIIVDKNNKD